MSGFSLFAMGTSAIRTSATPSGNTIVPSTTTLSRQLSASSTLTYTVSTSGISDGTVLYWTNSGTATDLDIITATATTSTVCGTGVENNNVSLTTANSSYYITSITFASYGNPTGSCGSFSYGACNSANSLSVVQTYALYNNSTVSVPATNATFGGDPCSGTSKSLYIQSTSTLYQGKVSGNVTINSNSGSFSVEPATRGASAATFIVDLRLGEYAGAFDGNGDYITTPANAAFGFGTGDFTVECWVKFNSTSNRQDIVWIGVDGNDRGGLIWNMTSNPGYLTYYISPTVANAIDYPWTPIANLWYHIALVRISGSTKLYINGVQGGSTYSDTKSYSNSNLVTVGKDTTGVTYLNGYVSNLRIVKGTGVYSANFTPPTSALTAIAGTSLLTCQNSTFIDNSTNNFTISAFGNATNSITASAFILATAATVNLSASQQLVCATANEGSTLSITAPAGTTFQSIQFASYGNPTGSCGSYVQGGCHSANSLSVVQTALLGKSGTQTITVSNATFGGDPCSGTAKRLYVAAYCI